MTGTELISALGTTLGRGSSTELLRYLNFAAVRIARTGYLSYSQETASVLFTGEVSAPIPTDFLRPRSWRLINGAASTTLKYLLLSEFEKRFPYPEANGEGVPTFYTRYGRYLLVNCPATSFSDGQITDITDEVVTGDADCLWQTAETAGTIAVGDFFKTDSDSTWLQISSIDSETQLTLSAATASGTGDYAIRTSYTTSLRYIKKPTAIAADSVEQPFVGYDDLLLATARFFGYVDLEVLDKAEYWKNIASELLEEARDTDGSLADSDLTPEGSRSTSLDPTGDPFVMDTGEQMDE